MIISLSKRIPDPIYENYTVVVLKLKGTMDVRVESTYQTPLSHSALFPLLLLSLTRQKHSPNCSEKIKEEYDFIIVGGGTAGSVVAGRLSEEPCVNILVLEAGPKPPLISEVPGLSKYLQGTDVDWNFETIPQKHAATGFKNKKLTWQAGKMLGGSGSFNGMCYSRGSPEDYDNWSAGGAKGWSYEEVLPYFLKLEDYRNNEILSNGYHHIGGPITIEKPCYHSELKEFFNEAAKELGYEIIDPTGSKKIGFYDYYLNMRNGQRCSSVKGYLVPAEHRPNLDILLNATATKVIMKDKRAEGVEFYHNGKFHTVKARREVIVSGGAVNTPKILMLSGIGPRRELEKFNIPLVSDLPVGKNLHDHGVSSQLFTIDAQFSRWTMFSDPSTIEEYIYRRTGPLSYFGIAGIALLSGLNASSTNDFPNYQIFILELPMKNFTEWAMSSMEPEISRKYFGSLDANRGLCVCSLQHLQPKSRGTVTLRSSDPFDPPIVDPNYLEEPKDLDDIVDGLRMCKKILNTKSFQILGAESFDKLMPGCENYANSEEEYYRCFARRYFYSLFHAVGTAKMGDAKDSSTVVDTDLRVKGVDGLRVIDASVMPIIPSGNTNIPTIMIAEKASDIVRKSINCSKGKNSKIF